MPTPDLPAWQTAPATAMAPAAGVDVWRILPTRQLATPAGNTGAQDKRRIIHAALHDILSRYVGLPAESLHIERTPGGKPFLAQPPGRLSFNLSHCADLALLAVSGRGEVGIDVEGPRHLADVLRVARRALPPDDVAQLERLEGGNRATRFLYLWTRMEARQKAFGQGIFALAVSPDAVTQISFLADATHPACVALALPLATPELRFFDYGPS